ncbi:MAG: nucleoside triphosphate pyrophosphohydrolase [Desulfobacteraceae bacterium]|nr:nucleoside triphosphate pyrophosphohydrolase [Desulfobacteraceae bacterium]
MEKLESVLDIIKTLRNPDKGCPWDREQTPISMWKCLIEEIYELRDAIIEDIPDDVSEELGDVLFQLLFIFEIYRERKAFDISESLKKVSEKMIRRHPHVYGKENFNTKDQVTRSWENIKKEEKKEAGKALDESVLDSVPSGMPSLLRCHKVSSSAVKAGFDWDSIDEIMDKVREEFNEFEEVVHTENKAAIADEFGDILFTLVNVARSAGIHAETALAGSIDKFERRYRYMEKLIKEQGLDLKNISNKEKEKLWGKAKDVYDK